MIRRLGPISIEEFDRMIEEGYFEEGKQRVDLIRGRLRIMSPAGPMHEEILTRLERWSEKWAPTCGSQKRSEKSIDLPRVSSVPEPDIVWVKDRDYMDARPTAIEVDLLIEVSVSSLDDDRIEMRSLYAEAGILEYWIVNCIDQCIEVHRKAKDSEYTEQFIIDRGQRVSPLVAPQAWLDVEELFARRP